MLVGTAAPSTLGAQAPAVDIDPALSVHAGPARWLQLTYELPGDRQALFPPGLHPTTPVIATVQVLRADGGVLGAFGLAQVRLSCRAGMRIRCFLLQSVIDGATAADVLSKRFGYVPTPGTVRLDLRADRVVGKVESGGRCVLDGAVLEPRGLDPAALQHIGNMNLGRTAQGLRLLQVENHVVTTALQRGAPKLSTFDADFWGMAGRTLTHAVIGASAEIDLTLPPVRFVQDPAQLAAVGTTKLDVAAAA